MSASNQLAQVEELASEIAARRDGDEHASDGAAQKDDAAPTPAKPRRQLSNDEIWARRNLRWQAGRPIGDIANALRVIERHEDFKGRFKYNEMVNRVLDKGTVMVDWRIYELCAVVQERFLPGIDETAVLKALTVAANKTGVSK